MLVQVLQALPALLEQQVLQVPQALRVLQVLQAPLGQVLLMQVLPWVK